MLKSDFRKLENLSPKDYAKRFRKLVNTSDIFSKKLSPKQQAIVYCLVYNLLEENHKTDSGYFLQKLLTEKGVTYFDLAQKMNTYLHYIENESENFTPESISSHLKKMIKSHNFKDGIISDLVCKYFSVNKNLLRYGIGTKYEMDYSKAKSDFEKANVDTERIEKYTNQILDLTDFIANDQANPSPKECDYYYNFISESPILFTNLLVDYLPQKTNLPEKEEVENLLNKEEEDLLEKYILNYFPEEKEEEEKDICYDFLTKKRVCLWDNDYLKRMFYKLNVKEQLAVVELIEQLENL